MTDSTTDSSKTFDVLIAGGGLSGMLTAVRLLHAARSTGKAIKIAVIEREAGVGGRLRSTHAAQVYGMRSYGLGGISPALREFWQHSVAPFQSDADLIPSAVNQTSLGILAGSKLSLGDIGEWFGAQGAKLLGGPSAAKQWHLVEEGLRQGASKAAAPTQLKRAGARAAGEAFEDDDSELAPLITESTLPRPEVSSEQDDFDPEESPDAGLAATPQRAFAHYWRETRKSPAAVVLEHFASAFGIPDVWSASPLALAERAAYYSAGLCHGPWDAGLSALAQDSSFTESVEVYTDARIISAELNQGLWRLSTEKGDFSGKSLVVAQPPWQAMNWLKRSLWPTPLLQLSSKTKPVSIVVLSETLNVAELLAEDIPDVILVPSEGVQMIRSGHDLTLQATIDFELSLQAPAVVKAVKSLKRAKKKLQQLYPQRISDDGHIALVPVAWAQSPLQTDRRFLLALSRKPFQSAALSFCGDAYGPHYDGDSNLISSLLSCCEQIVNS